MSSSPEAALPPEAAVPPEGVLEELDGTPIVPYRNGVPAAGTAADEAHPGRRPAAPWWRAALLAVAVAAGRPALWAYALVAFLARGGLLVLAGPIVVLPTLIGLSNLVGPASVTAGGPGPRLVAIVGAGIAAAAVLVVTGTILAAAAETALHRATVAPAAGDGGRPVLAFRAALAPAGLGRGTVRISAVRFVLLGPVVVAITLALPAWVEVAYRELTLPSDVAAPLLLRVLAGAPAASWPVALTWLAGEVIGGFAARRAVLLDASWPLALGAGLLDPLRAPVGTALSTIVALALGVVALALGVVALGAAWEAASASLVDEGITPASAGLALLLVSTWIAALVVAGIAAAVRATIATAELLRHLPRPARASQR